MIRDRIFIASAVRAIDLENRWSSAIEEHSHTLDAPKLGSAYDKIRLEIVKLATETK